MFLFKGILLKGNKSKTVSVFSTEAEAKEYCQSHGKNYNYKPVRTYACFRVWKKKE